MFSNLKKNNLIFLSVLVVLAAFLFGMGIGYESRPAIESVSLKNKETMVPTQADFAPFWVTWNLINEKYVNGNVASVSATTSASTTAPTKKMPTDQEKVWGAISGLVKSLNDPYTIFMPPKQATEFENEISGSFEGVGMEVGMKNDAIVVIAPLEGTPAKRAGILAGDRLLLIDDKPTFGMGVEEAVSLIRGKKGTAVKLSIQREGEQDPIEKKITRDVIDIPTLQLGDIKSNDGKVIQGNAEGNGLRKDGVFVVRLFNFSAKSADLFREALRKFVLSGSDKLLLDLRGNPGGYLEAAVDMASWFLPQGKVVVSEVFGNGLGEKIHRSKGYDIFNKNLKFAILVDRGSASASEILSGALGEHGVAKLIGEKTFGKGSVQELVPVTGDTFLKITVAKWLTPNRHSISDNGLTPDIIVPITKEDVVAGKDRQFDRAVKYLIEGK